MIDNDTNMMVFEDLSLSCVTSVPQPAFWLTEEDMFAFP